MAVAMNIGDEIEAAMWITGAEAVIELERMKAECAAAINQLAAANGFFAGPTRWSTKRPGEARVPPVPGDISGPNVQLLVVEATVVARRVVSTPRPFTLELDRADLERLRALTRRGAAAAMCPERLTDDECDSIINEVGPDTAMKALRRLVGAGELH